jgi:diacylglycerol kinase (ATP)
MKNIDKKFSFIQRAKSFNFAGRGIYLFIKTTHNAWIHIAAGLTAIFCGFYFDIDRIDWILLIIIPPAIIYLKDFP